MSRVKKIFGILIAAILIISVFALSPNIKANNFSREVQAVGTEVDSMGQLRESLKEAVIMYIGSSAAIINGNKVLIDDKYPEITPIIHNGIVFIPLRITAEGLGWKVGWDGKTSSITAILGKKTIKFRQGSDIITTDGVQSKINTPVMAVKGRTFVSLTEFVEVLGVKFVNNQGLIVIGENENLLKRIRQLYRT